MVVLAVAITTSVGKPILSRQFVEMSRFRIEGLLGAFPKLLESGNKQHTYFETDSVRYLYHPMDELYVVLAPLHVDERVHILLNDKQSMRSQFSYIPIY